MVQGEDLRPDVLARRLAYAGYVLVAYELVKSMIVSPIKAFYADTTFGQGMPFKSYDDDVRARHKNEFEACLLYLRDFMEALDADDVKTIQDLREHRNNVAHNLARKLPDLRLGENKTLWPKVAVPSSSSVTIGRIWKLELTPSSAESTGQAPNERNTFCLSESLKA